MGHGSKRSECKTMQTRITLAPSKVSLKVFLFSPRAPKAFRMHYPSKSP